MLTTQRLMISLALSAMLITPTTQNLGAGVAVEGTFYAIHLNPVGFTAPGPVTVREVDTLDLTSGNTTFLRKIARSAGPIFGAAPVGTGID